MRTNPAYVELAFRKAIVGELIGLLRTHYTPAYGDEPEKKIICEDVFRDDSEVTQDAIEGFIGDLTAQEADLNLELNKFEFVKREGEDGNSISTTKGSPSGGGKRQAKRPPGKQGRRPAGNKAGA